MVAGLGVCVRTTAALAEQSPVCESVLAFWRGSQGNEKNLCYAFIYADGVKLRAWWTFDGIFIHMWRSQKLFVCVVLTSKIDLYCDSSYLPPYLELYLRNDVKCKLKQCSVDEHKPMYSQPCGHIHCMFYSTTSNFLNYTPNCSYFSANISVFQTLLWIQGSDLDT